MAILFWIAIGHCHPSMACHAVLCAVSVYCPMPMLHQLSCHVVFKVIGCDMGYGIDIDIDYE
jgi:hypothetical protein